jgi:hypothetical protein
MLGAGNTRQKTPGALDSACLCYACEPYPSSVTSIAVSPRPASWDSSQFQNRHANVRDDDADEREPRSVHQRCDREHEHETWKTFHNSKSGSAKTKEKVIRSKSQIKTRY